MVEAITLFTHGRRFCPPCPPYPIKCDVLNMKYIYI